MKHNPKNWVKDLPSQPRGKNIISISSLRRLIPKLNNLSPKLSLLNPKL